MSRNGDDKATDTLTGVDGVASLGAGAVRLNDTKD